MAPFTCIACNVVFTDAEIQRSHYKTDWHRYNLKRKIAELPPITEIEFQEKVELQTKKKVEKLSENSTFCKICNKSFSSDNAYTNHIKSKKHKEMSSNINKKNENVESEEITEEKKTTGKKATIKPKLGYLPPVDDDNIADDDDDSDDWEDLDEEDVNTSDEEIDDELTEAIPQTFCLFCPHESVNVPDNIRHMSKSHSFYVPDIDYMTDVEGFLIYLGAKVGDGKVCLRCNNHSKQFQSVRACQAHMLDKGHCALDYEGNAILEYADFYDFSSSYPDQNGDVDADSELSNDDQLSIDPDTLELVLPSGARAGHRALKRYYNQSLSTNENNHIKSRAMITNINSQYKVMGLTGTALSMVIRKRLEAKKRQYTNYARKMLGMGMKNNKLLQPHFRKQVMYAG